MINQNRGMIAVEVESNDLSVMEILEIVCDIELGDIINGNLDSTGSETVTNISKDEEMDVYIEGVGCSVQNARNLIR